MTIPNGHDSIQTISHNGQHHHYSSLNNTSHRQIFLDFGCTDAIAIKVFLGLKGVSKDTAENGAAKSFEGKGADGLWEIYCVEALPRYGKILNKTIEELTNVSSVKSFSFFTGVAVSNKDGTTKLMYDTEFLERASYGNSILPEKHNYKGRGIDIKTYDIVTFMRDIVQAKQSDEVICKMDIEGSEYDVLRRIFTSGIIKLFDELYVEHHWTHKEFKGKFDMPFQCVEWMFEDVNELKYHRWK